MSTIEFTDPGINVSIYTFIISIVKLLFLILVIHYCTAFIYYYLGYYTLKQLENATRDKFLKTVCQICSQSVGFAKILENNESYCLLMSSIRQS